LGFLSTRAPLGAGMVTRYVMFAIVAMLANLATQEFVIRISPFALTLSILAGTAAGFILKYILDKWFVFEDGFDGHSREVQKVALYGAFSVGTTFIFWAFEVAFWTIWKTDAAKYTGAVIGLAIGYAAKFALDRAFVFRSRKA
jgi:hypothetical protein